MLIRSVILENFRVFQGKHRIDLNTEKSNPIVLFGGLNGAGKTSILTAVKVALFGKSALKGLLTNKAYHLFLADQVNRGNSDCNNASVAVEFGYSKLGSNYSYLVERSWKAEKNKVKEYLAIHENGKILTELSLAQGQSFVFDLIPPGVADLFFFDGEKIKEMADDEDGEVLIEALKKLVGVDLIEKAAFDTGVVLRKNKKQASTSRERGEITALENELVEINKTIDRKMSEYGDTFLPHHSELLIKLRKANQKLDESGGAWAKSRDDLISAQGGLVAKKKELESRVIELMRGDVIFSLCPNFVERLLKQLKQDLDINKSREFNDQLDQKVAQMKDIDPKLLNLVKGLKNGNTGEARHQISSYQFSQFEQAIKSAGLSKEKLSQILKEYDTLESRLDELGLNISRAPDESKLKEIFSQINNIELEVERSNNRIREVKGEIKQLINNGIQLTYALEKIYDKLESAQSLNQVDSLGSKVILAMEGLAKDLIQSKISELEIEFNAIFQRLTRKIDMTHKVKINRDNCKIELVDKLGNIVDKKRISSGEKQIYAFSILEALGKVSGRSLPFIVDTPLGRLDSKHRSKLVKNFFPVIGEQVIILSTDTEVDEDFYKELAPNIGKSYQIRYCEDTSSSVIEEGYFWPQNSKEKELELLA